MKRALALALPALCAACAPVEGAKLFLTLDDGVSADRVVVSGVVDGDEAFDAAEFPDAPRALEKKETLVVVLDEDLVGEDVAVTVEARDGDAVVAIREKIPGSPGAAITAVLRSIGDTATSAPDRSQGAMSWSPRATQ